jgi:hypothetical protein
MAQMLSESDPELAELSFDERLGQMVEKEWFMKKNARIKRFLINATWRKIELTNIESNLSIVFGRNIRCVQRLIWHVLFILKESFFEVGLDFN